MNEVKSREVINSLFVDVFNSILHLEENFMVERLGNRVTINEVHVIEAIILSEKKSMGSVAKRLMVTEGTLTTSINKLLQKGLIEKKRDEFDRRVYLLSLTDEAEKIMAIHKEFHEMMINHVLDDPNIDDSLIDSLKSLKEFFDNLKEVYKR